MDNPNYRVKALMEFLSVEELGFLDTVLDNYEVRDTEEAKLKRGIGLDVWGAFIRKLNGEK